MNKVFFIGRAATDIDVRYTPAQVASLNLTIAIDRGKDKDGNDKGTDFPRVTVFNKQAENCEKYLAKGRLVAIEGRLQTGSYQNKNGDTVYTTDVIANRVEFLGGGQNSQPGQTNTQEQFEALDEDVPF